MSKSKEVAVRVEETKTVAPLTPNEMILAAVNGKADLDKVKQLMEMQKEYEERQAKKVFASSFAAAQEKIGVVVKTKMNPQTHSKYADLGDIIEMAKPIYTAEGFAVIFYEGVTTVPENVRICADVLHKAGHKESYYYDVPLDGEGIRGNANMTKIHGKVSSSSYAMRILMRMIWNVPLQDDDGNAAGAPVELIDEKQIGQLTDMVNDLKGDSVANMKQFKATMKITELSEILKPNFQKAVSLLVARKKQIG